MSDPTLATVTNDTLLSIFTFIYFTNLDSCTSASTMPDQVQYTLRFQEYVIKLVFYFFVFIYYRNGPFYYRAQYVKILADDYLWSRAPEDFCQGSLLKRVE
jgi:hypothetical protein